MADRSQFAMAAHQIVKPTDVDPGAGYFGILQPDLFQRFHLRSILSSTVDRKRPITNLEPHIRWITCQNPAGDRQRPLVRRKASRVNLHPLPIPFTYLGRLGATRTENKQDGQ